MDPFSLNAVDEMDAARAALKQTTAGVLDAICAVLAGLYPEGKYFAVNNLTIYDANGRVTHGPRATVEATSDTRFALQSTGPWTGCPSASHAPTSESTPTPARGLSTTF
jgi:hypothetical protein